MSPSDTTPAIASPASALDRADERSDYCSRVCTRSTISPSPSSTFTGTWSDPTSSPCTKCSTRRPLRCGAWLMALPNASPRWGRTARHPRSYRLRARLGRLQRRSRGRVGSPRCTRPRLLRRHQGPPECRRESRLHRPRHRGSAHRAPAFPGAVPVVHPRTSGEQLRHSDSGRREQRGRGCRSDGSRTQDNEQEDHGHEASSQEGNLGQADTVTFASRRRLGPRGDQ